jgi:hypothetical protein
MKNSTKSTIVNDIKQLNSYTLESMLDVFNTTERKLTEDELAFYAELYKELENRKENPRFGHGGNIAEQNKEMLDNQAREVDHHIDELNNVLKNKVDVESWVVAKMERATTDLSDITHYLDGEQKKEYSKPIYAEGGNVKIGGIIRLKNDLPYLASLDSLKGKDLKVKDIKNIYFASGSKLFYVVNHDGHEHEINEDFIEHKDKMASGGTVEITSPRKNIMGTLSFSMKFGGMRKPQEFIVYPVTSESDVIRIQSDTRFGIIGMKNGDGLMSQSHSSGAYGHHMSTDKLIPFSLNIDQLEDLKEMLAKTSGKSVGSSIIKSDNSGANKFEGGGVIGKDITFNKWDETRSGTILELTDDGDYVVSSGFGNTLVSPDDVISFNEPKAKSKRFGFFENGGGVEKDSNYYEIIRKIENNERLLKNTYGSERVEQVQQEIQRLKDKLKNKYGYKYSEGGGFDDDFVIFSVDDDALDTLLNDFHRSELDYEDIHGDSYYKLNRRDFDRFIDYADSNGFDVDYENNEDAVVYVVNPRMAEGGMTEHGLDRGDTIVFNSGDEVMVIDKKDEQHLVDLDKGMRYEGGGTIEIGDKVKASKEYGGKSGVVVDKIGSFVVVENSKGVSESYHESDLIKKMAMGGYLEGREEYEGYNYKIWYNPNKRMYSVSDEIGVFKGDNNYFEKYDQAKEHAEISIRSILSDKDDKMANGGGVDGWKKGSTIPRESKTEAEKNKQLLKEYYGENGRNFKVEKISNNKYVVTYEFNLTEKMSNGGGVGAKKDWTVVYAKGNQQKVMVVKGKDKDEAYREAEMSKSSNKLDSNWEMIEIYEPKMANGGGVQEQSLYKDWDQFEKPSKIKVYLNNGKTLEINPLKLKGGKRVYDAILQAFIDDRFDITNKVIQGITNNLSEDKSNTEVDKMSNGGGVGKKALYQTNKNEKLTKQIIDNSFEFFKSNGVNYGQVSDLGNEITIEPSTVIPAGSTLKKDSLDGMQIIYDIPTKVYEVSEYMAGPNENEMYIFGEYKSLIPALKSLIKGNSSNGRKPIKKYSKGGGVGKKEVAIGFGGLGNGTTVWDKNRIQNGDYKIIAHISDSGKITYHDKKLPQTAITKIEEFASKQDKMSNGGGLDMPDGHKANIKYLNSISETEKNKVLKNIANHYGISIKEAEEEVTNDPAEYLYEYIANDASLRMEVYKAIKLYKMANGGSMTGWKHKK